MFYNYKEVECPHCGNEILVNNRKEILKCRWCRRIVKVKFVGRGKKAKVNVEAIDFPKEELFDTRIRSYDDGRGKDIHGYE